jgi:XTP/dITP diphosphohydrolase
MEIRLATNNQFKIDETIEILKGTKISIVPLKMKIEELQTLDVTRLVKDKLLKAFSRIGRPLIVEHTGLYIEYMNGFPGGLTQIFWDSLEADKFTEIIGNLKNSKAIAKTTIGYCDGKKIHFFKGEVKGKITKAPLGKRDFQWDCVFIPEGESETFAEMGDRKNQISMRKLAIEKLKTYINL